MNNLPTSFLSLWIKKEFDNAIEYKVKIVEKTYYMFTLRYSEKNIKIRRRQNMTSSQILIYNSLI